MLSFVQNTLHEVIVQPILFASGLMAFSEIAFDALEWFIIGLIEVIVLAIVLGWAEKRFSFDSNVLIGLTPQEQRFTKRTDIAYTLLHRLGLFPLLAFALLTGPIDWLESQMRLAGISVLNLDQVYPGLTDLPVISFLIYLVVLDFVDYWMHRGQHRWHWWWELHAVHHSQRHMTQWSDQRNHLFDDLLRDFILAAVALFVGVAPEQFIALVVASRVMQSIQHANVKLTGLVPSVFQHLLVGPRFHRVHHGIGVGHEGSHQGVNFGVLFSFWDKLFKTADFSSEVQPTGIRDQLSGRDYGRGFFQQQGYALRRIFNADR
jgi:sterol desaturase/sphingolipid hydroxylase (fatty acid hydroxylase superfamily)